MALRFISGFAEVASYHHVICKILYSPMLYKFPRESWLSSFEERPDFTVYPCCPRPRIDFHSNPFGGCPANCWYESQNRFTLQQLNSSYAVRV